MPQQKLKPHNTMWGKNVKKLPAMYFSSFLVVFYFFPLLFFSQLLFIVVLYFLLITDLLLYVSCFLAGEPESKLQNPKSKL